MKRLIALIALLVSLGAAQVAPAASATVSRSGQNVAFRVSCVGFNLDDLANAIPQGVTPLDEFMLILAMAIKPLTPELQTLCNPAPPAAPMQSIPPVWVPFQSYKLLATDSEEQYGEAVKSFDGRIDTIWHTQYKTVTPQLPHYVAIDLQVSFNLSKFRYLSRQDTQQGGRVKNYEFYVSADGVDWGSPVAEGVFPDTNAEQVVSFPITTGRYVKFEARSEHAGGPYSSAAELAVFGTLTKVPKQPQIEPAASTTQTWVVHNNGRVDRPVYVVVNGALVPHKTERATYGEPCGAFYARVGSTKLEYRRLVRNNDFISICAGK